MSFQPIINITNIPRDATSFIFTDITGNSPTNPTGFGAVNAPANRIAITALWGEAQLYAAEPIHGAAVIGTLSTTITVPITVLDGVQWLRAYYGEAISVSFTVSTDRLTLTTSDSGLIANMDNVVAIGIDYTDYPTRIVSVNSTTIVLTTPLPGILTSYTTIYRYWQAQVRTLVLNCAESIIGSQIATLPVYRNDCEKAYKILDKLLLKLNAEYAFNCGNFSEANTSAQLICGTTNSSTSNCTTCG